MAIYRELIQRIYKVKNKSWRRALIASVSYVKRNFERNLRHECGRLARRRVKPRNSHRDRGFALREMDDMKPELFKRMFRLDRQSFDELVELLDPLIKRDDKYATISSGSPISTRTRLAICLRWLSGGSYIDIRFAWGVSKAAFFSERGVLWPTIEALDHLLEMGIPLENKELLQS